MEGLPAVVGLFALVSKSVTDAQTKQQQADWHAYRWQHIPRQLYEVQSKVRLLRLSLISHLSLMAKQLELVRAAQSDIDFAMIQESRKTRRAVESVSREIGSHIEDLRYGIEGGFARIEVILKPDGYSR